MVRYGNKAKSQVLKDCHMPDLLEAEDPKDALWTATKVIATIGPAVHDVESLVQLLEAGVTCCRVDLTWGSVEYHRRSLANLLEASKRARKLCAVMVDNVGREIFVHHPVTLDAEGWPVHGEEVVVSDGARVVLSTRAPPSSEAAAADPSTFYINYPDFTSMVGVGDQVFLGRYLVTGADESSLYLQVVEVCDTEVICTAMNDAVLGGLVTVFHVERSSGSLENVQNNLPVLTDHDKAAIKLLSESFEIDFLALSYCRSGEDVTDARAFLDSIGMTSTKVVAKLESRQSLFNFKGIAGAADGIILSRGNLGLDVVPEKMALIQKSVIANCNILGKPVIVTRLVDTMSNSPRPTRAEATDVANAVIDGADAFLLGAETLRGKFPLLTVSTILSIARQAEAVFDHTQHFDHLMQERHDQLMKSGGGNGIEESLSTMSLGSLGDRSIQGRPAGASRFVSTANLGSVGRGGMVSQSQQRSEAISSSAVRAAEKVGASLIVVYTLTGRTASLVARYRPPMPILTLVVPELKSDGLQWSLTGRATARQCLIERGLLPVLAAPSPNGEGLLEEAICMMAHRGLVRAHDHVVVIQMLHDNYSIKIISVDEFGSGIADIRPQSLVDLIAAEKEKAGVVDEVEGDNRGAALSMSRSSAFGSLTRSSVTAK